MEQMIESGKIYRVRKYDSHGKDTDYGTLLGEDVKPMLKGRTYWKPEWEETGMWFSKGGEVGIEVIEVK